MNATDVEDLFISSDKSSLLRGNPGNYRNYANQCSFQGFIALPISATNVNYDRDQGSIFIIDEKGNPIGELLLCKNDDFNISSMPDELFCAYINEVSKNDFGFPGNFKHDYLLIKTGKFPHYKKHYMTNSSLWGGFVHKGQFDNLLIPYKVQRTNLTARKYSKIPNRSVFEISIKSVLQFSPFERYLRLYHLIELLFDWYFVQSVKGLNEDLLGVGKLFNEFRRDEYSLLLSIVKSKCNDLTSITNILNIVQWIDPMTPGYFYNKSKEIFNDYSKETNPFKEKFDKFEDICKNGGFTITNIQQANLGSYNELIFKVTGYWLYRVRCSIAHNRLGEYIMTVDDEKFVAEFAEPLLKEVLHQIFNN